MKLDRFTTAYLETMLWGEWPVEGTDTSCLDLGLTADDIAPEALAEILADCAAFQRDHWADIWQQLHDAGHDFYVTRNHIGDEPGFWQGSWPEDVRKRLAEASEAYGYQGLMAADDDGNPPLHIHKQ